MKSKGYTSPFWESSRLVLFAFRVLRIRWVNFILRHVFRVAGSHLPTLISARFPVTGDIKVLLPNDRIITLRTDGRDTIASRIHWKGVAAHEPETIGLYLRLIPRMNVVLDVGASSGLFSLIAGATNPDLIIYAFEPVPETFEFLTKNIAVNGLRNIIPVQACVTNYEGAITIYPNLSPGLPFQASTIQSYRNRYTPIEINAKAVALDSYLATEGLSKIDLIKIDAESSDPTVLEGSQKIIKQHLPLIIGEVLYRDTDHQLQKFFYNTGYKYFSIEKNGLVQKTTIIGDSNWVHRNYLFIHESRLESLRVLIDDFGIIES